MIEPLEYRTYIIAEAGVNHNGSVERALKMVDVAVEAGADAVKFQTFRAEQLTTGNALKAEYQRQTTNAAESQLEILRRLELDERAHHRLVDHCRDLGIELLSTPFDEESLRLIVDGLQVERIKIGSGDLTNGPLLLAAARTGRPVILSTGMATLYEIRQALGVLAFGYVRLDAKPSADAFEETYGSADGRTTLNEEVTLLQCTTAYPGPFEEVNFLAIDTLRQSFGVSVGLSDHTPGWTIAIAAAARGAAVVEKHFTLDRTLPGPDHRASLEPSELRAMVTSTRQVELALGDGDKKPTCSERMNMAVARKSLVVAKSIRFGEPFSPENLTVKRPGTGISPFHYWDFIGRAAPRDYEVEEVIEEWPVR